MYKSFAIEKIVLSVKAIPSDHPRDIIHSWIAHALTLTLAITISITLLIMVLQCLKRRACTIAFSKNRQLLEKQGSTSRMLPRKPSLDPQARRWLWSWSERLAWHANFGHRRDEFRVEDLATHLTLIAG